MEKEEAYGTHILIDLCFLVIFDRIYFFGTYAVLFFKRQNSSLNREREGCKVNVKI